MKILILVIILLLLNNSYADDFEFGSLGARPLGMGGAFVAISDDANCVYYNPAGLAILKTREETFMYAKRLEVLSLNYIGLVQRNIGFGFVSMRVDLVEGDEDREETTTMSESVFAVSFAKRFSPSVSIGGSITFPILDYPAGDDWGVGLDVGALFQVHRRIRVGVLGKNIGVKVRDVEVFPRMTIGGVVNIAENIIVAADLFNKENYEGDEVRLGYRIGGEYLWRDVLAFRCGIDDGSFTLGVGFIQDKWQLDCAFAQIEKELFEQTQALYISATLRL
jgi:hypothetical protein